MKASELIAALAKQISERGDYEVKYEDSMGNRNFVDLVKTDSGEQEIILE